MRVEQSQWSSGGWGPVAALPDAQLVLLFGSGPAVEAAPLDEVRRRYPEAHLFGCSTAGEIHGTKVGEDGLVVTAVRFDATSLEQVVVDLAEGDDHARVGRRLAAGLPAEGLVHVLVLSDGIGVNGSALVEGMTAGLPSGVQVTGGLAGDGDRFGRTFVFADDGVHPHGIVALGLYGDRIRVGYGSLGGWDPFGPQRRITRSEGNVLYELDGVPALDLYREYLGDQAAGLPASGLLFPLSIRSPGREEELVRTILGMDEEAKSLTFAGDVPEGAMARLMRANFDRLVDGAHGAAKKSRVALGAREPGLALLISCVGRRLVLKQRIEDELDAVREVLGPGTALAGFYSYGEICPVAPEAACELHNQTMTITTLWEDQGASAP